MAKHYTEVAVDNWNTAHFQSYLADKHLEVYGIHYAPKGGIMAERALLARYIGKRGQAGLYSKETVKAFIDRCFQAYKPTPAYPGLTFWFMSAYMLSELQRVEAEANRKQAEVQADDYEELEGWL